MLPAKLEISYSNIFIFLYKLKETFKFWANGCLVKDPVPPPPFHTQDTVKKNCVLQVKTKGAVTWQVLIFLLRVAGFQRPRSHMIWTFKFLILFL